MIKEGDSRLTCLTLREHALLEYVLSDVIVHELAQERADRRRRLVGGDQRHGTGRTRNSEIRRKSSSPAPAEIKGSLVRPEPALPETT